MPTPQKPHQYQGQSPRRRKRQRFSQASTRRPIVLYDQHGREWTAQVGLKSGMSTGSIVPNFHAPWYPDQQFMRVNADNTSELYIDYAAMLLRRNARMNEYHKGAIEWARDRKIPAPEKLGEYTDQIRRGYGAPPKPIEPIVAAMQGNKYILGFTDRVDPRLERFIVKPRNEQLLGDYDFRDETIDAEVATAAVERARTLKRHAASLEDDADIDAFDELGAGRPDEEQRPDGPDDGSPDRASDETSDDTSDELTADELLASLATEAAEEELEETFDAAVTGGRTIPPGKMDQAARQAPRRPPASPVRKGGSGSSLSIAKRRQIGNRPTLADGAAPVISGE